MKINGNWTRADLSGTYKVTDRHGNTAPGGLNPAPRKGDTAQLARYARRMARASWGGAPQLAWEELASECERYAALFEQGSLFDGAEVAA